MLKRMAGVGILMLLAAAPLLLSPRPVAASVPTQELCYVGTGQFRYGIVIYVTSPEQARQLIRKKRAFANFNYVKATFQGFQVCKPTKNPI